MLSLLRQLKKKHEYTFDQFLIEEGKRSGAGDEIRNLWKDVILGTLFVRLAWAKDITKMKTMVDILRLCSLHDADTIAALEAQINLIN